MPDKLFKVVSRIMGVPAHEIVSDSSPKTIAYWDSMKHIKLILAVEEEFNVTFSDEEIANIQSVGNLIDILAQKGVAA